MCVLFHSNFDCNLQKSDMNVFPCVPSPTFLLSFVSPVCQLAWEDHQLEQLYLLL